MVFNLEKTNKILNFEFFLTYGEIVDLISFDCKIFESGGITGVIAAAKRCFRLSCTDKRGFALIKNTLNKF
jgi:hypothetical protein